MAAGLAVVLSAATAVAVDRQGETHDRASRSGSAGVPTAGAAAAPTPFAESARAQAARVDADPASPGEQERTGRASEPRAAGADPAPTAARPPRPSSPGASSSRPTTSIVERPDAAERREAAEALLAVRGRAVLDRDRAAFLATVDPRSTRFRARQAALFDALAQVPLTSWSYALHPEDAQRADPRLDRRRGTWWAPRVTVRHALRDVDREPAESTQHLTFTQRGGRWYVAADDDFTHRGDRTQRQLWDGGPVVAVHGKSSTVLGHPGSLPEMRRIARDVDAAVPKVAAWWGSWRGRVAVLVPQDQAELAGLVETRGGLGPIAALAVAGPVRDGRARGGDRVLVNPRNLARLSPVGRRVVLTHEVTHVATRAATGPLVPAWLAEGVADHVGYAGTGVSTELAAAELRADVRAGRVPSRLPRDEDFDGDNPRLPQAYEQAWLAVEELVDTYGERRVRAFYRALGSRQRGEPAAALDAALHAELGTSTRAFTATWRASVRRQLG